LTSKVKIIGLGNNNLVTLKLWIKDSSH